MFAVRCRFKLCSRFLFSYVNYKMSMEMSTQSREKNIDLITDFNDFKLSPLKLLDLPIESNRQNYVRRYIKGVIFSHVTPQPLTSPKLVSYSSDALIDILDLDPVITKNTDFVNFIAGNNIIAGSTPLAHRYGGHQFGVWAMQLGDGRAILLGEYTNRKGERWELQLKGSGKTPYSRDGDGRAVLRSSIREFLCSEAMFYLGIPTSRAGAIIVSGDKCIRDILYDGHPQLEPIAVVLRLAESWFRIGSLELLTKCGELELLKNLINFILKTHFPEINNNDDSKILNFLAKVIRSSSDLVIKWQSVGFTHGVLNTDNMSLLGITIDYGPFGFMEAFDFYYVPNHSDLEARYCYGRQIEVVLWNMLMLSKAVSPLLTEDQKELLVKILQQEARYVNEKYIETMSYKLGFEDSQKELVEELIQMFKETKADFNMTLRELSENSFSSLRKPDSKLWAIKTLSKNTNYYTFIENYEKKINETGKSDDERMRRMCQVNPCYILRNWMAQEAIGKAESGDHSQVNLLLKVLKDPFTRQEEAEKMGYSAKPPGWASSLCLSCSS